MTVASPRAAVSPSVKYLTFFLGLEEYGIATLKVREIIGIMDVTRVPGTQTHVQGVINLRGRIIPVIDLRAKLGMHPNEPTHETCVVVVQRKETECGLVVDRVAEVCSLPASEINPMLELGRGIPAEFFIGVSKAGGRVRLLLDIERVLHTQHSKKANDQ